MGRGKGIIAAFSQNGSQWASVGDAVLHKFSPDSQGFANGSLAALHQVNGLLQGDHHDQQVVNSLTYLVVLQGHSSNISRRQVGSSSLQKRE